MDGTKQMKKFHVLTYIRRGERDNVSVKLKSLALRKDRRIVYRETNEQNSILYEFIQQ